MTERTASEQRHRFRPGQSGNPNGRPKGSKHRALTALDAIGEREAEGILEAVVKAAQGGDTRAADILLRRIWPERKGRPVPFELPRLASAADAAVATAAIVAAVAAGELTPEEAQAIASVLETHRRTLEMAELERRLAALEQATATKEAKR